MKRITIDFVTELPGSEIEILIEKLETEIKLTTRKVGGILVQIKEDAETVALPKLHRHD